jgi:oxygen tolerance protein BatD
MNAREKEGRRATRFERALPLLCFFALLLCLFALVSRTSHAESTPQIQLQVDEDTVGVGDVIHLQMNATSADAMPSDPRLGATPGFTVRGQSASPTQTHISINGNRMDRYTLVVDWALQAQRVGTFTIPSPSVAIGGARFAQQPLKVRVVAAGQAAPHRARPPPVMQSPFGFSPFDPWKSLIPGIDGLDSQSTPAPTISTDPKLSLDAPRGNVYFLHATIDKTSAVVGEQVTFSVYEYLDVSASDEVAAEEAHDARVDDFVKHPLLREDQDAVLAGYASVGGRTWVVKLVRRWALFPLRTGDLAIGPLSETLARPAAIRGQSRATEALRVQVSEPPLAGRPAGYLVGDVGRFSLAVQVQPREVEQGGAVGVHVDLSGTGNLPSTLDTGAREGVEWLTPETHDAVGPVGHDAFGGKRSFDYVVRMKKPGNIDLGTLALSFWDPEQKRYEVARAPIGFVRVAPSSAAATPADSTPEILPGLPPPRAALQGVSPERRHADDTALFWIGGIGAWPAAFALAVAGRAAGRRARRSWRRRRISPAADLKQRVALAHAACQGKDPRQADAAIARALEAASIVHAGVSVRAAVGWAVVDELERAGVARNAATCVADLLRECEAARFSPDSTNELAARDAARDRWARAQQAIQGLEKRG